MGCSGNKSVKTKKNNYLVSQRNSTEEKNKIK